MKVLSLKQKLTGLVLISFLVLTGCDKDTNGGNTNDATAVTGSFIDAPVKGLNYSCSSGTTSTTNNTGEYTCSQGDNVTFSIGTLVIGTIAAQTAPITPYTLFPNDYTGAVNLARLLQSLDTDGDVNNNLIDLDTNLAALLPNNIDFTVTWFDTDVTSLGITLRTAVDAKKTMDDALTALEITPALKSLSVAENLVDGFTVIAADANNNTLFSLSGTDATSFDINASTGVVTFKIAPDHETQVTYTFTVTANDGSLSETQDVTITVANVVETPPILASFSASINENVTIGTVFGNVTATAEGESITAFTLNDTTNFAVDAAGEISTVTTLDFETTSSYSLTVIATNTLGDSSPVSVIINVARVAESAPATDQNLAGQMEVPPAPPAL